jgi:hypothetical protein
LLIEQPKVPKCHFLGTVLVQFAEGGGTVAILLKLGSLFCRASGSLLVQFWHGWMEAAE